MEYRVLYVRGILVLYARRARSCNLYCVYGFGLSTRGYKLRVM